MTREQQLEKELAEIRKARTTLVDKLDDARKMAPEGKAVVFDAMLTLAQGAVQRIIDGKEGPEHNSFGPVVFKFLDNVIGPDAEELIRKVRS